MSLFFGLHGFAVSLLRGFVQLSTAESLIRLKIRNWLAGVGRQRTELQVH